MGRILTGDALTILRKLPAESVNCCITSPPYWGLRDYGVTGQLGLEATPELYVAHLVEVLREVRRVLRDDGTLWLNLGDCYNARRGQRTVYDKKGTKQLTNRGSDEAASRNTPGLKPKDLAGIPWRVAFALQADGWYLRSDIIWHKPNPMPESVWDRPTKAHEYLFLLAKSAKYYYDTLAIAEPCKADTPDRYERGRSDNHKWADGGPGGQTIARTLGPMAISAGRKALHGPTYSRHRSSIKGGQSLQSSPNGSRNRRTVWTVTTQPFKGAHFATFPRKLIEHCILAGCPAGGTVLDPFAGTCTTGLVAQEQGRHFLVIELNPAYVKMGAARLGLRVRAGAAA